MAYCPDHEELESTMASVIRKNTKPKIVESIRPSRDEAEAAIETLLRWAGDDPTRPVIHHCPGAGCVVCVIVLGTSQVAHAH